MAEASGGPEAVRPNPMNAPDGAEEPIEGMPVLPEILQDARRRLEADVPGLEFRVFDDALDVTLPVERLIPCCETIKKELGYLLLMSVTAVDWKDSFELIYHTYRTDSAFPIVLRCRLPREESPEAPSLISLWPGADYQEREIYDLMGIVFTGHPDLRRILLADDFLGHPLRKDFQQDPEFVLVPHLRVPGYAGARAGKASTGRFLDDRA
jgi:NADH-quinone oxidoreductase subunit C